MRSEREIQTEREREREDEEAVENASTLLFPSLAPFAGTARVFGVERGYFYTLRRGELSRAFYPNRADGRNFRVYDRL